MTAGEAGQDKELLILDKHYQVLRTVPLDIGPRHFTLPGPEAALPAALRKGDRQALPLAADKPAQLCSQRWP